MLILPNNVFFFILKYYKIGITKAKTWLKSKWQVFGDQQFQRATKFKKSFKKNSGWFGSWTIDPNCFFIKMLWLISSNWCFKKKSSKLKWFYTNVFWYMDFDDIYIYAKWAFQNWYEELLVWPLFPQSKLMWWIRRRKKTWLCWEFLNAEVQQCVTLQPMIM